MHLANVQKERQNTEMQNAECRMQGSRGAPCADTYDEAPAGFSDAPAARL